MADPNDFSNRYNTPIPAALQPQFQKWLAEQKQKTGRDVTADRYDYDVNGFFMSGQGTDSRGHATDQFKKPNHPTFSTESQYNGMDGYYGGQWNGSDSSSSYTPSVTNLEFHPPKELQQYFNEVEPDTRLNPPYPIQGEPIPGTGPLGYPPPYPRVQLPSGLVTGRLATIQ